MPIFLFSGLILLADQLTKFLILKSLSPGESIPILNNIFHITLVQNKGAAFGMLSRHTFFLILISIAAVGFIIISHRRFRGRMPAIDAGCSLILGGTLGNLVDRLRFGFVIDFLDFRVWPVFNVADSAICIGAGLLAIGLLKKEKKDA